MDIRQRQSVLSFAGGKLVFSPPDPRMAEAPVKAGGEPKEPRKAKGKPRAVGEAKKKARASPARKSARKSADKPLKKKHKRKAGEDVVKINETKKRLRSFVKKRKKKRKQKGGKTPKAAPPPPNPALLAVSSGRRQDASLPTASSRQTTKKKRISKPKLVRVSAETTPEILEMEGSLVPSDVTLEAETQHLNRQNMVTGFDGWMEAEIRQMLNSKQEAFCLETSAKVDSLREQLPRMTRAEEEKWLVEVSSRDRSVCEMGLNCESVCMSKAKGVNPPIRLPCVEKEGFGSYKMCLLCLRNTSTCTLLRLRMDRVSMIQDSCLQTHANYVNLNGEYKKEHTLPIRRDRYEGVVAPMVAHFHSGYNGKEKTDDADRRKRYWAQDGYTLPSVMPYDVRSPDAPLVGKQLGTGSFLLNAPQTGVTP